MAFKVLILVVGGIVALMAVGWLGLQVKPRTGPPASVQRRDLGTVALPRDLPEPVYRHYETAVGREVPRVETAVVWGAPRLRVGGVWAHLKNVTYYAPGQHYREMAITWFGMPVLRGHEYHKDGQGLMNIGGEVTEGPQMDEGACLGSWGEALIAMPTLFVTDPGVRWEAVDDTTARLIVPCGGEEIPFTVDFDQETGLMRRLVAMRYRGLEAERTPWHLEITSWETVDSTMVPALASARWEDERLPYTIWSIDGAAYNVDISDKIPSAPAPGRRTGSG